MFIRSENRKIIYDLFTCIRNASHFHFSLFTNVLLGKEIKYKKNGKIENRMKYRQQFILVESKKFACWEPLKRKIHICISNPRVLSLIEALLGQTKHIYYKVFLSLFSIFFCWIWFFFFVSFVSYSICVNQDGNRVTYTEYFYRDHIVIHFIFVVVVVVLYNVTSKKCLQRKYLIVGTYIKQMVEKQRILYDRFKTSQFSIRAFRLYLLLFTKAK